MKITGTKCYRENKISFQNQIKKTNVTLMAVLFWYVRLQKNKLAFTLKNNLLLLPHSVVNHSTEWLKLLT